MVVLDDLPDDIKTFSRARLRQRTDQRLDLSWGPEPADSGALAAVVVLPVALHYGAGTTLGGLLNAIAEVGHPQPEAVLRVFAATASRNRQGSPLYFVLGVPNKAGAHHHLVVGRLPGNSADGLRDAGALLDIDALRVPPETPIEWCALSDERSEIVTRRDTGRPVNGFVGKTVHIWGCGGLGSWMAEFIARAGAARMLVCDPGFVGGGLLVRQNYTEHDVGLNKAEALVARLRLLNDNLVVEAAPWALPIPVGDRLLPDCDVLVDATVSIALGTLLDSATRVAEGDRPLIAQVATDVRTGSLGILTVTSPDYPRWPGVIDHAIGQVVLDDGALERFHCLWQEPTPGDEIIPARGCSTPTFHGSGADLAAVAGVLVSLLGSHVGHAGSGTHLVALPHAAGGPAHRFLPAPPVDGS